jgi:GntR family L-lactate dehydrogenase operon transcriptional regulator
MADINEKNNPLEYHILNIMTEAGSPLGAGAICEKIQKYGICISEAGTGRALRGLRVQGLLTRIGFQGHVITDKGLQRLKELEKAREFGEKLKQLLNEGPLKGYSVKDILVARRALEREAAFQAALNADPDEIAELQSIISAQYDCMRNNENYADMSNAFHRKIIEISHAPALKNLYELIGLSVQWQDFFIDTFKMYNQPLNVPHEKIFLAIKDHDPHRAATLMYEHLSDVMDNACKLCLDECRK